MRSNKWHIHIEFNRALLAAASMALLVGATSAGRAETVSLHAVADGRIFPTAPDTANDNQHLAVYTSGSTIQRSVIQFDLGSLPAGFLVESATLTLTSDTLGGGYTNSGGLAMEVYRLTQSWVEGQVTANDRDWGSNGVNDFPGDDHPWNTLGGDYVGTSDAADVDPYASSNVTGIGDVPITWDVTQLVGEWYTGASANHGVLLRSYDGNKLHFCSSEHSSGNGPVLSVTLVPEPSTCILLAAGLIGLAACAWRRKKSRQRPLAGD